MRQTRCLRAASAGRAPGPCPRPHPAPGPWPEALPDTAVPGCGTAPAGTAPPCTRHPAGQDRSYTPGNGERPQQAHGESAGTVRASLFHHFVQLGAQYQSRSNQLCRAGHKGNFCSFMGVQNTKWYKYVHLNPFPMAAARGH